MRGFAAIVEVRVSLFSHADEDVETVFPEYGLPGERVFVDPTSGFRTADDTLPLIKVAAGRRGGIELAVFERITVISCRDAQGQILKDIGLDIGIEHHSVDAFGEFGLIGDVDRIPVIVVDIRVERGLRDACTAEIGLSRFVEFERKSRQGRSDDACNLGRAFAAGRHSVVDDSVIADIDTRAYKIRESVVDRSFSREFLPIRGDEDRFVLHVGTGDEHTRFFSRV